MKVPALVLLVLVSAVSLFACNFSISSQPQNTVISAGESATLSVSTAGARGPVSYQWYRGVTGDTSRPIFLAVNRTVTVSPAVTESYWVAVTNQTCTVFSASAIVTVT